MLIVNITIEIKPDEEHIFRTQSILIIAFWILMEKVHVQRGHLVTHGEIIGKFYYLKTNRHMETKNLKSILSEKTFLIDNIFLF